MKILALFVCGIAQISVSFANDAHFLSDAYIEKINNKQNLWQAGRNFDPNTPLSEIKKLMGTFAEGGERKLKSIKTFDPLWPGDMQIPKRFDSRKKWHKKCPRIGEVLDQGRCGSCWAISTAQAFTDRYCIATNGKHQMRLSTAHALSCCFGFGCGGGWEHKAWSYFYIHGLPSGGSWNTSEGCQPYSIQSPCNYNDSSPYEKCPERRGTPDCPVQCTNEQYSTELSNDYRYADKEYRLPENEKSIMKDIMTHGPVTVFFNVRKDFLNYKSGIYDPVDDDGNLGGHAVKLIGWGFEKNVPYWLVMNSWNDYWGDHGLVKMKRNSPKILLEDRAWAAVPDTKRHGRMENVEEEME